MSRFNYEAYDKLFPRTPENHTTPESAVSTFHPTKDKIEGNDPDVTDTTPDNDPEIHEPDMMPEHGEDNTEVK